MSREKKSLKIYWCFIQSSRHRFQYQDKNITIKWEIIMYTCLNCNSPNHSALNCMICHGRVLLLSADVRVILPIQDFQPYRLSSSLGDNFADRILYCSNKSSFVIQGRSNAGSARSVIIKSNELPRDGFNGDTVLGFVARQMYEQKKAIYDHFGHISGF
jgi:hypothetical protein